MKLPRIVEVENAPTPVVVYEGEEGELIVEVDAELKGRERAAAIIAAVRSHKRNFGSIILLPLALYAWEPIKNATRNTPGAALSTTAAGVGLIATAVMLPVVQDDSTTPFAAAPTRTIIATITATSLVLPPTDAPTARRTPRTPRTPRTAPSQAEPANTRVPAPQATRRPVARSPEPRPSRASTRISPPKVSAAESAAATTPLADADAAPTALGAAMDTSATPPLDSVAVDPPNRAAPEPTPQPPPSRGCLIEVNLDPLAHVCVG